MKEIKTILFALDISDVSEYAFGYAAAMAESFGAKLAVIHVVHHQTDLRNYYVPEISFDNIDAQVETAAKRHLKNFCEKHRKEFPDIDAYLEIGVPHEKIVEKAEQIRASMIVMGTHGRQGFDHFLFGSTAEGVVKTAPCPVLTVRPPVAGVE